MEGGQKMFQLANLRMINDGNDNGDREDKWVVMMEGGGEEICCHSSSIESSHDDSINSESSLFSTSSDLVEEDDASSLPSSASSSSSNGPLYELSALMAQLPVKRGLSKFYQAKSQSFTSLANVNNIEDLAKKVNNTCKMRMKSCKSYAAGLDGHNKSISPKATIGKKSSRGSPLLSSLGKKTSLVGGCRPAISVQRNFG